MTFKSNEQMYAFVKSMTPEMFKLFHEAMEARLHTDTYLESYINPQTPNADEIAYIKQNNIIQAIKTHRVRTGMGLKESKDICDAYRQMLRKEHAEKYPNTPCPF